MNSLSELMVGENKLSSEELKSLCFQMGADDVGFVSLDNPLLDDQRADIQKAFPQTRTLISIVMKMNREPIRATAPGSPSRVLPKSPPPTAGASSRAVACNTMPAS